MDGAILAVRYQKGHQNNGFRFEFVGVGGGTFIALAILSVCLLIP